MDYFFGTSGWIAMRWLAAIPVYNEVASVQSVLDEVIKYAPNVLAVNDGSSDGTAELLDRRDDITVCIMPRTRVWSRLENGVSVRHRRRV